MPKNIIFCADGTWNSPNQDDNQDGVPEHSNVYKLFLTLSGDFSRGSLLQESEQEKQLLDGSRIMQVAKYIHGVGDSKNPFNRLLGGATGAGTISRIVRGYTFISRNYNPGDRIYIIGFSRGAYTARALAGMIAAMGLLKNISVENKEEAYRLGSKVWYKHRSKTKSGSALARLVEIVNDLPAFFSRNSIKQSDLVEVPQLAAVAVWDTVGALGIPEFIGDGKEADAFQFTNKVLSPKVKKGFHAVALDERRNSFTPALWQPASNLEQVLFPGAHADVGGGYPESGLSDIALDWMFEKLSRQGVYFGIRDCKPDPGATAHMPWKKPPFNIKDHQSHRQFDHSAVVEHDSIVKRTKFGKVRPDPNEAKMKYAPENRPLLKGMLEELIG